MGRLVIALALGCCLVVAVRSGDNTKKDQEAIQGTWRIVEHVRRGEKEPVEKDVVVVFEGGKWQLKKGKTVDKQGTFKLDATKTPKVIVMDSEPGIYSLEKGILKVCTAQPGNKTPPSEFTSTKENKQELVILERDQK